MFKTFERTEPLKTGYFDGYGLTDSYEKQWKDLVKRIKNRPFPEFKEFTKQWRVFSNRYKAKAIREWKSQIDEDVNEFMYEISLLFSPENSGMDKSQLKGYSPYTGIDEGPAWLREIAFDFFINSYTGNQQDIWKVIPYDISAKLHNIFSLIDDTEQFSDETKKEMVNLKRYLNKTSAFTWSSGKLKMASQNGDKWF